jgi:hypothetical protein
MLIGPRPLGLPEPLWPSIALATSLAPCPNLDGLWGSPEDVLERVAITYPSLRKAYGQRHTLPDDY